MWNIISIVILAMEVVLLASYILGRLCRKKINETIQFLAMVFTLNLALYLVPFLYQVIELGQRENLIFGVLECINGSIKLFVGDVKTEDVAGFVVVTPIYTFTYLAGALLALIATVSATIEAFGNALVNRTRLTKRLNQDACDLVVGNSPMALSYAKNSPNAVVLLSDKVSRDVAVALMDDGYVVLRRNFTEKLMNSRFLRPDIRYNVIIPQESEDCLEYVETFIKYRRHALSPKDICFYLEVEEHKAHTIRREVIEKSGLEECIFTYSREEIMAHSLMETHPITEYLPGSFIEPDASVKADAEINVYFLGFGALSREIYRQSVLNNQFVSFMGGEYALKAVNYYLWDKGIDRQEWCVEGLKNALEAMSERGNEYLPLPELPYNTTVEELASHVRDNLEKLVERICKDNAYSMIYVDTGDCYRNIDTACRIRSMMDDSNNYHLFVRSEIYAEDDAQTTYYGDYAKIYTHKVVVNEELAHVAKTINAVYEEQSMSDKKGDPDFAQLVEAKARESWSKMNHFTRTSNIYAALSLRTKINLLGLSYTQAQEPRDCHLVTERYGKEDREYEYDEYFGRSVRNSLLAQEHARWNTYHLLLEFMPMPLAKIKVTSQDGNKVSFATKNMASKRHSCLTTFKGLHLLGQHKAKLAAEVTGIEHTPAEYDVYKYDEMLVTSAEELLTKLNCHVYPK